MAGFSSTMSLLLLLSAAICLSGASAMESATLVSDHSELIGMDRETMTSADEPEPAVFDASASAEPFRMERETMTVSNKPQPSSEPVHMEREIMTPEPQPSVFDALPNSDPIFPFSASNGPQAPYASLSLCSDGQIQSTAQDCVPTPSPSLINSRKT